MEKPTSADLDQVRELLELIKGMKVNGVVVVVSFIVRSIQPCKERAHPGFDFKVDTDGTRERMDKLTKEAVLCWATELFTPSVLFSVPGRQKPSTA